mmetsp:Transcript_111569/g.322475  ORF Transcript_111569/g.322475 Transcript_111569/m.322475 type:complete len:208 (+) Transcript_111569:2-625(+)
MTLAAWCHVDWMRLGLACGARSLYSFSLTCFAVADWTVGNISVQQRYWRYWAKQGTLGGCAACRASGRVVPKVSAQSDWALRRAHASANEEEFEAEVGAEARDSDLADFLWHRLARREALQAKAVAEARRSVSLGSTPGGRQSWQGMLGTASEPATKAFAALAGSFSPSSVTSRGSPWAGLEAMRLTHHVADRDEDGSSTDSAPMLT